MGVLQDPPPRLLGEPAHATTLPLERLTDLTHVTVDVAQRDKGHGRGGVVGPEGHPGLEGEGDVHPALATELATSRVADHLLAVVHETARQAEGAGVHARDLVGTGADSAEDQALSTHSPAAHGGDDAVDHVVDRGQEPVGIFPRLAAVLDEVRDDVLHARPLVGGRHVVGVSLPEADLTRLAIRLPDVDHLVDRSGVDTVGVEERSGLGPRQEAGLGAGAGVGVAMGAVEGRRRAHEAPETFQFLVVEFGHDPDLLSQQTTKRDASFGWE